MPDLHGPCFSRPSCRALRLPGCCRSSTRSRRTSSAATDASPASVSRARSWPLPTPAAPRPAARRPSDTPRRTSARTKRRAISCARRAGSGRARCCSASSWSMLSRRLRSAGVGVALALAAWAAAAWLARVPWPLAGEHAFVFAREGPSLDRAAGAVRAGVARRGRGACCSLSLVAAQSASVHAADRGLARRLSRASSSRPASAGCCCSICRPTGSFGNRYLALYHQGHLWLGDARSSACSCSCASRSGASLALGLSVLDGVGERDRPRVGARMRALPALLLLLLLVVGAAFGALLAEHPPAHVGDRPPVADRRRGVVLLPARHAVRRAPGAQRQLARLARRATCCRWLFVVLVLSAPMVVTRDMGPLLIAGYAAGAFLAASIAMWWHQRCGAHVRRRTRSRSRCSWPGSCAMTLALFELGAIDDVTAGRLENLAAPLASANDQLALVTLVPGAAPPGRLRPRRRAVVRLRRRRRLRRRPGADPERLHVHRAGRRVRLDGGWTLTLGCARLAAPADPPPRPRDARRAALRRRAGRVVERRAGVPELDRGGLGGAHAVPARGHRRRQSRRAFR